MPNVHLTKQMEDYVDRQIRSGPYSNVSEVVRAGLRRIMEEDGANDFYRLRAEIDKGMEDIEAGRVVDFDPVDFDPVAFEPRAFRK